MTFRMPLSECSGTGPPGEHTGYSHHHQYTSAQYHTGDRSERHQGRSTAASAPHCAARAREREDTRRNASGKYSEEYKHSGTDKEKHVRYHQSEGRPPPEGGAMFGGGGSGHSDTYNSSRSDLPHLYRPYAPMTGQMRSGHLELDSLYGGPSEPVQVNSMNAPNNSTVQCGCENIDCQFCNLMLSMQMKE